MEKGNIIENGSNNIENKALNRPSELQDLIFPGFEGLAVPNIMTLKPKNGQRAIDLHDYDFYLK